LNLPSGDTITDSIAFNYHGNASGGTDISYAPGNEVFGQGVLTINADAASRVLGTTAANTPTDWYGGYLQYGSSLYDNTVSGHSYNLPSDGGALTPGDINNPAYYIDQKSYNASVGIGVVTIQIDETNGEPPAGSPVTVNYATLDGTATAAGGDYGATSGSFTFMNGGPTSQSFSVAVFNSGGYFDVVLSTDSPGAYVSVGTANYGNPTTRSRILIGP